MRVDLLSTGRELLEGRVQEANAYRAAGWLAERGFTVGHVAIVSDRLEDIAAAMRRGLERAEVLVCSGGLGPTEDDRTSAAAARLAGVELVTNQDILQQLRSRFEQWNLPWTENQARQAAFPAGAQPLENPLGTAPGFTLELQGRHLFCLPGPPGEFTAMFRQGVLPRLEQLRAESAPGQAHASRVLRVFGRGEGWLQDRLHGLEAELPGLELGFRAALPEIELVLHAQGDCTSGTEQLLDRAEKQVRTRLGHHVFASGTNTLPQALLERMRGTGLTLALAESCTGGLAAKLLTDIPGASQVFLLSAVTYSNQAKVEFLGVEPSLLDEFGAVSSECVTAMARGVRERSGASIGAAVSGIAGPDGGSAEKPVGLVHFAVCDERGCQASERRFPPRDRDFIRRLAAHGLLWLIWRHLQQQ